MRRFILLFLEGLFLIPGFAQNSDVQLVNTGKMYIGEFTSAPACALFIAGDFKVVGDAEIHQAGKTALTGDFINNVESGNVFIPGNKGFFEFCGTKVQHIKGIASKESSYIDFPGLIIDNQTFVADEKVDTAAVLVASNVGISTLDLHLDRGRLILDSDTTDATGSKVAHLYVKGTVTSPVDNPTRNKHEKGLIQVNLATGNSYNEGRIMGFTPPFKTIYSDYFFYNFVSRPTNKGLFGDDYKLIVSPKVSLNSGRGYLVGLGLVPENDPYYEKEWSSVWNGALYTDRFTDRLSFARDFGPESLMKFVNSDSYIADAFSGETINVDDVKIPLEDGWNYLGNPYTTPIDMSSFLEESPVADKWGISRGAASSNDVQCKYYILSQGYGSYDPSDLYSRFKFNVTYLVGQKVGGTIIPEGSNPFLVAPMQLFVVRKNKTSNTNVQINIPEDVRTHGQAKFIRKSNRNAIDNELLIETTDSKTKGYDRLCLVFRADSEVEANRKYEAPKFFNNSGGVNQVYTKNAENKDMTTNVLSASTEKVTMYFKPAAEEQDVLLSAYRLNSLTNFRSVILEDTKNGMTIDLMLNSSYNFISSPADNPGRFVLHFNSPVSVNAEMQSVLEAYYSLGSLYIRNLQEMDLGGTVSLYDVSGVLVLQEVIAEIPVMQIATSLNKGTYILKLAGKRNLVVKIAVR